MAYGTDADRKSKKLTDEEIEQTAREFLRTAMGAPDTDVGQARLRNLEYYNAEPEGELAPPEVEDRSDFVATDVADTVDGMLPQIMRMFVGSDDAVAFEGQGQPGSEEEAKLATAYINHLFYVRNDGVGVVHDWFKDALTQKVGFLKVWAEEEADDAKRQPLRSGDADLCSHALRRLFEPVNDGPQQLHELQDGGEVIGSVVAIRSGGGGQVVRHVILRSK